MQEFVIDGGYITRVWLVNQVKVHNTLVWYNVRISQFSKQSHWY